MSAQTIKILSYIHNFRKVICVCPQCHEINSLILNDTENLTLKFKCDACRQEIHGDFSSVTQLIPAKKGK